MTWDIIARIWLVAVLGAFLASCGSVPKERVVYRTVEKPVLVPCRPDIGERPEYPTIARPIATEIAQQMKDLHEERKLRMGWETELEAALAGCAGG